MVRYNESFINLLDKLTNIMLLKGEQFRAKAYSKAMTTIMQITDDITNVEQLKGKPNIGDTIYQKLEEFVKTGTLKILEDEKKNPVNILSEVYGIGPKKAEELVKLGITNIQDLEKRKDEVLNDIQRVGLKYNSQINQRIPRQEIEVYKKVFDAVVKALPEKNVRYEIVGSYRRGAETSGDIDVIITSTNPQVYVNFVNVLINKKIIVEVLSRGPSKCLVIAQLTQNHICRRVDFLYTPPNEFAFALLYFTGSKIFNTCMRQHGLNLGYTFNEHGIHRIVDGKKGPQVEKEFPTEQSIFEFLGLQYKEPLGRRDGRDIMPYMNVGQDPTWHKELKQSGIKSLQKYNEQELTNFIKEANNAYYNKTPFLTDTEYDILKEFVESRFPKNEVIKEVGAPVVDKNKVQLPYEMWSMDKIKPDTNALNLWTSKYKGPYTITCKLDGISALYTGTKLYTRGNGIVGQDISHLIPYLSLPQTGTNCVVRGELIMSKQTFNGKYKEQFANPRNLVAGIVNLKTIDVEKVKDIDFVSYEIIVPQMIPSKQIEYLFEQGFHIPNLTKTTTLTNEFLTNKLVSWRNDYSYEIDGIIVTDDKVYPRKSGNPEHAFAFKMVLTDQVAEAKVVDVIWTPSKDGYLKPRVQIEPINLGGVQIEYATGFNGAFIYQHKIGIGSVIELIRSGDVIPHITKVLVPASEPKMPQVPFKWNDTKVDIMLVDASTDNVVKEKNITGFFKGIGVEGLSSGNVTRIMNAGFDSVASIIAMEESDFLKVEGFKDKMAAKIYNGIKEKIHGCSLVQLMDASNIFGRGFSEKKIELIMTECPDILISTASDVQKIQRVEAIKGMARKTSEAFVEKIPDFIQFLKEANLLKHLATSVTTNPANQLNHYLTGKTIVMTGSRDKSIIEFLKNVGATLGTNVSKNTYMVIAKSKDDDTGKAEDARKLNIPIVTIYEFAEKYM
jgi:DNA ligase (NAD+)